MTFEVEVSGWRLKFQVQPLAPETQSLVKTSAVRKLHTGTFYCGCTIHICSTNSKKYQNDYVSLEVAD